VYEFDEIISIMRQRRTADSVLIRAAIQNRDRFNGDVITVMPDVSSIPAVNRPGPNFFQEAVDGLARSANAIMPKINTPVYDPGKPKSEELSAIRQGALYGQWFETQLELKLGRAYRHLAAYGTCAFIVIPDDNLGRADIQIRDPLTAYPELRAPDDIRPPRDCGFLFARSAQWIKSHYPGAPEYLAMSSSKGWDTLWDVVEWIDEDQIVIGVMGPRFPPYGYADSRPYGYNAIQLGRWPNKAGCVPVAVPRRVTLDRIMGQLTAMINYSDTYSRFLALEIVAAEKGIFPDMVVMGRTGMPPQLVGGVWKDGRTGDINMVIDGTVETIGKETSPTTMPVLQMMDNHIRGGTGASPLYGGSNGGMRTGAGVDALGNFSVNPMAAEAQLIMEYTLAEVNRSWMEVQKGYYGDKEFTCILGLQGSAKTVTYTPNKHFERTDNVVSYVAPGADINQYAVALTQLVAAKGMSRKTMRDKHPLIDDAAEEEMFVALEEINDAVASGIAQVIATDPTQLDVAARASQLMEEGITVGSAWLQAKSEIATQEPGGVPGGPDAAPTSPSGAPIPPGLSQALAASGAGPAVAPGSQIPAAQPDMMSLRHAIQGINEQVSSGAT
jgi:hypothetical protein